MICMWILHKKICLKSIIQLWWIAGTPRSGKGTQYPLIKEEHCLCHLATGDMPREAVSAKTPLGIKAKEAMEKVKFKTGLGVLKN